MLTKQFPSWYDVTDDGDFQKLLKINYTNKTMV